VVTVELVIANLADEPELPTRREPGDDPWPEFMNNDPMAELYYADYRSAFPEFALVAFDPAEPDRIVARAFSVPFTWEGDPAQGDLPVDGWDGVIWRAARDRQEGRRGNLVSALEITVRTDLQGTGLAARMLAAMRDNAVKLGFADLVAPVRPNFKHRHPLVPIAEYADRIRADGLPEDPWLRVHVRAGGRIVGTCNRAMVIPGTLQEWREWTGLPFDTSGQTVVPFALNPVDCVVEHNYAVYVESAVWVHHQLVADRV
jgi:GNAT superfamily N-acetyltransferase